MYFLKFKVHLAAQIAGVCIVCSAAFLAPEFPAVTMGWSLPRPQCQQHGSMCALYSPWTVARQDPLSMELYKQEYWSGLPFPTPRDLPNSGIKPASLVSPALADGTTLATWMECNPCVRVCYKKSFKNQARCSSIQIGLIWNHLLFM